ncbi:MAG TPA: hypothetical protein VMD91_04165 [Candidatus Sulfotelmatobacter sp.]|nr:hypothetical protein [Candidatus Sulfotelmatobacter sp.]
MRVLLVAALCTVVAACGGTPPPAGSQRPSSVPTPAPVGASLQKQPIVGLIDMQDISWHDVEGGEPTFTTTNVEQFPGLFGGIVINATWDQMQPSGQGGPIVTTRVDAALAQVRAYNATFPATPLGVKLRIYAGSSAPTWAQLIGEAQPIQIQRNAGGCSSGNCPLTIGKFWDPSYIAAWRTFQAQVAAIYDDHPLIRQIAVTSCTSQTDEPFVPTSDATSKRNMKAAGYTDAAYQTCLSGATTDYAAWRSTLVDYTFNTFVSMQVPSQGTSPAFTQTTMQACATNLGSRCVTDNHALSDPLNADDTIVYATMPGLGVPVNFQTQAPRGFGCQWTAVIAQGIAVGAKAIEVWPEARYEGFDALTVADVASLTAQFTAPIAVPAVPNPLPSGCTGFDPTS